MPFLRFTDRIVNESAITSVSLHGNGSITINVSGAEPVRLTGDDADLAKAHFLSSAGIIDLTVKPAVADTPSPEVGTSDVPAAEVPATAEAAPAADATPKTPAFKPAPSK